MKKIGAGKMSGLAIVAALAACGGGGSSSPSASSDRIAPIVGATADLGDDTVAQQVLTDASGSIAYARDVSGLGGTYTSLLTGVSSQSTHSKLSAQTLATLLIRTATANTNATAAAATSSQTTSCSEGGTLKVSASQAQAYLMNAGDQFELTATECRTSFEGQTIRMHGQLKMRVIEGSNLDPSFLRDSTVGFEITPFVITLVADGTEVGLDGGFSIHYNSYGYADSFMSLDSAPSLTTRVISNAQSKTETISNFSYRLNQNAMSGQATVNSNRTLPNPVLYQWSVPSSSVLVYGLDGRVNSGTAFITSGTGPTMLRLKFDCSVASRNDCISLEKSIDGVNYQTIRTYTMDEFEQL